MVQLAYIIEKFPSATEYFILNEILELQNRGLNITVFSIRKPKFELVEAKELKSEVIYMPKGLRVLKFFRFIHKIKLCHILSEQNQFNITDFLKKIRNFFIASYFADKLKDKKILHIHAHFAFISTDIALILSKILNIQYSFTAHAQDIYLNQNNLEPKIKNASFVLTCTKYNLDFINNITEYRYADKIDLIYHGINIYDKTNLCKDKFQNNTVKILTIARLVEKKGLEYLLKSVKILVGKGINVKCTIIGDGPLKKILIKQAEKENISGNVEFKGILARKSVLTQLALSDIFVLPCIVAKDGDRDGIPNVLLESMLLGVPVISTNVSAITELIENEKTGLLVPEKNETAIADSVLELMNNQFLYQQTLKEAKEKIIREFDTKDCTGRLQKIFLNYCEKN